MFFPPTYPSLSQTLGHSSAYIFSNSFCTFSMLFTTPPPWPPLLILVLCNEGLQWPPPPLPPCPHAPTPTPFFPWVILRRATPSESVKLNTLQHFGLKCFIGSCSSTSHFSFLKPNIWSRLKTEARGREWDTCGPQKAERAILARREMDIDKPGGNAEFTLFGCWCRGNKCTFKLRNELD